jgi:hypothetical protein
MKKEQTYGFTSPSATARGADFRLGVDVSGKIVGYNYQVATSGNPAKALTSVSDKGAPIYIAEEIGTITQKDALKVFGTNEPGKAAEIASTWGKDNIATLKTLMTRTI